MEINLGLMEFAQRLLLATESIAESLRNLAEEAIVKDPYKRESEVHKLRAARARTYEDDAAYKAKMAVYRESVKGILDTHGIEYSSRARLATLENLATTNINNVKLPTKPVRELAIAEMLNEEDRQRDAALPQEGTEDPATDPVEEEEAPATEIASDDAPAEEEEEAPAEKEAEVPAEKEAEAPAEKEEEVEEDATPWGKGHPDYDQILAEFQAWCRTNSATEADIRPNALAKLRTFRVDKFSKLTAAQAQQFRKALV